jgi:hypothetical protein
MVTISLALVAAVLHQPSSEIEVPES